MIKQNRFDYVNKIGDKKGYLDNPVERFLFGDELSMKIPLQFKYRPDLISRFLYGTPKYAWLLAYLNNFNNTPQDFETGVTIIYTNPKRMS